MIRLNPAPEGRILLGLSGGADSVALLMLLSEDRETRTVTAVHVNHGLRGAESDGDEAFVRELCGREGVPLRVYHPDLGGRKDENAAREARYACFRQALTETGIRTLVLAHHRDDQAETFLMRLLRGAGPEGLSGMSREENREGIRVLRPLLDCSGEELREWLRSRGSSWREDSSNAGNAYLRNRIRHELLPLMEKEAPGAAERIARTAELIRAEHETVKGRMDRLLRATAGETRLPREITEPLTEAERTVLLRRWWETEGPALEERSLNYRQTKALSELTDAAPGTTVNLPGGWRARRGRDALYLLPAENADVKSTVVKDGACIFGNLRMERIPPGDGYGDGLLEQAVPPGFLEGCEVRTRQPGDRIRPFGMTGSKSLQDYFTDRKVDAPLRDRIPLVCREHEVLWAVGVGIGAIPRVNRGEPYERMKWTGDILRIPSGKEDER